MTEKLELDLVLELTGPLEGKRVLDVGTGDGTYAIAVAERGAPVVGLDLSPEMLDAAGVRAKAAGVELDLREGSAEALPFTDGEFDPFVLSPKEWETAHPGGAQSWAASDE